MRRRAPFVTLTVLLAAGLLAACGGDDTAHGGDSHRAHGGPSGVEDDARQIPVTADAFAFDPLEITARAGEPLAIALTSVDILHDFVIDELDAHVAAAPGETMTGGFRAGEPGRYTFYCAERGHLEAGMKGTLIVE